MSFEDWMDRTFPGKGILWFYLIVFITTLMASLGWHAVIIFLENVSH